MVLNIFIRSTIAACTVIYCKYNFLWVIWKMMYLRDNVASLLRSKQIQPVGGIVVVENFAIMNRTELGGDMFSKPRSGVGH